MRLLELLTLTTMKLFDCCGGAMNRLVTEGDGAYCIAGESDDSRGSTKRSLLGEGTGADSSTADSVESCLAVTFSSIRTTDFCL